MRRTSLPFFVLLLTASLATAQTITTTRNTVLAWTATWGGYDITSGDVDGDGDADLVVGMDHDPNRLLLNDGRGSFLDATAGRLITPIVAQPSGFANATYAVDLVDIDGDGDLDLLTVNDHNLHNRVYLNDGLGTFTDVTSTALAPLSEWSVDQVVADFDGDGDADWLVINSGPWRLYSNNGTGTFSDVSATALVGVAGLTWGQGSFAADLDGDSDLDVVIGGSPAILQNQGGVLTRVTGAFAGVAFGSVFGGDIDGDGLVDLFVQDGRRLFRNTGGLTYVDVTATRMPAGWSDTMAACADFDLDGDVDVVSRNLVLHNDGTGIFTVAGTMTLSQFYLGGLPCVVDIDGDGDLDVVDADSLMLHSPYVNLHTQVLTPTAPTLGQPYTIEFRAPVRPSPVLFGPAVANAGTRLPLPPYGTLRIDLTQGTFLWPLLTTTGLGTITWTIPNQLALLGTELHYQSVVFDPLRAPFLTNTLRDVIQ